MDIGQEDKGKPLQRCLSFLPCSSKTSGAVSVMQIRVFFLVSPGRFLCSAFDHVFRSAASARHGPHGSSQSPAVVFARQGIQLSNFKSLHIPPFVKGKKKGFRGGVISFFRLFKSYPVLSVCPPCNGISLSLVKGKIMQFWVLHLLKKSGSSYSSRQVIQLSRYKLPTTRQRVWIPVFCPVVLRASSRSWE